MLWWFLILGVSASVVASVSVFLYMMVRRQMQRATGHSPESDSREERSSPPEA
jgi:preprotein translocase subunit YajC